MKTEQIITPTPSERVSTQTPATATPAPDNRETRSLTDAEERARRTEFFRQRNLERDAIARFIDSFIAEEDKFNMIAAEDMEGMLQRQRQVKLAERDKQGKPSSKKNFPEHYDQAAEDKWLRGRFADVLEGRKRYHEDDEDDPEDINVRPSKVAKVEEEEDSEDSEDEEEDDVRQTAKRERAGEADSEGEDDRKVKKSVPFKPASRGRIISHGDAEFHGIQNRTKATPANGACVGISAVKSEMGNLLEVVEGNEGMAVKRRYVFIHGKMEVEPPFQSCPVNSKGNQFGLKRTIDGERYGDAKRAKLRAAEEAPGAVSRS